MIYSNRPADNRKQNFKNLSTNIPHDFGKKALRNWMHHNVTWVSGMSGSTNIILNFSSHINNNNYFGKYKIDSKIVLLAALMFLVYDGGHSIAEVLWACRMLDKDLKLNFNLTDDNEDVDNFIPNFLKFQELYKNTDLYEFIKKSFDKSFDNLIIYFKKYDKMIYDN